MGSYKRIVYDAFCRYNRKVEKSVSQSIFCSRSDPRRAGGICSQPSSILQNLVNKNQIKSPNFIAKRFYSSDVKPKSMRLENKRWYENRRNLITIGFAGCAVVIFNLEKVPYAERRRFMMVSTSREKKVGDTQFKSVKGKKVLGSDEPESIRVEKIGQDIIRGLFKMLENDNNQQCAHLKELKWEIIVVDDPNTVKARCLANGKIVVYTGLLNLLKTDDEIATVIGHEVGGVVARRDAEIMSSLISLPFIFLILHESTVCSLVYTVSCLLYTAYMSYRQETEADYIGLLISASAGYDPRIAPEVCTKLAVVPSYQRTEPFMCPEPSYPYGERRGKLLSQPKVMEEALAIYKQALNF